jgi:hypothetical protein
MVSLSGSGSSSSGDWTDMLDDFTKGTRLAIGEAMWRSSWSYSEELRSLKVYQIEIETLRTMQENQSGFYKTNYDVMTVRLSSLGLTNKDNVLLKFLRLPDWEEIFGVGPTSIPHKTIQAEAARRIVITAIALKRFQLKQGGWPQRLNELAPEFISSVPIDPFDGKPLKYHPNTDGTYCLYSVGEDGIDDGGDVTPAAPSSFTGTANWSWQRARDWVWPQPATPEEVQYFHEHPPK